MGQHLRHPSLTRSVCVDSLTCDVLQVAVESPQGLKQKLLNIVGVNGAVTDKTFSKVDCGPTWKSMVFSLCLFHAVVQERNKYGTLGWNIPYTFTSSDLEVRSKQD